MLLSHVHLPERLDSVLFGALKLFLLLISLTWLCGAGPAVAQPAPAEAEVIILKKAPEKPAAKTAPKAGIKPAPKPAARVPPKPGVKVSAKAVVKPGVKVPSKTVVKTAAKGTAKPGSRPSAASKPQKSIPGTFTTATPPPHKTTVTPDTVLAGGLTARDLRRISVGNQAGVLKITAPDGKSVAFVKEAAGTSMKGIDGVQWAPLAEPHRRAIFDALALRDADLDGASRKIVALYPQLSSLQAVALVGVLASVQDGRVSVATRQEMSRFLASLLSRPGNVQIRRQAVLAMALASDVDPTVVRTVIDFMTSSRNAWETFTVQQFFEYHRAPIRAMGQVGEFRQRIGASGSPYTATILQMLQ